MSLRPQPLDSVPAETARVARAAFRRGNPYLRLRDTLGTLYSDADFAPLFPTRGQPAEAPYRLALVTVFQFAEGLSDRQAAEAVRARVDWKYALGLELTDSGFDFSVLSEFRDRLLAGQAEALLLDRLLDRCRDLGLVKERQRQRTDATHVLAAVRALNRLELVGETLRATLNALAVVAPDWLRDRVLPAHPDWRERYDHRFESSRWPQAPAAQAALADQIGADGAQLFTALYGPDAPPWLREVPAVEVLRQVWLQQFHAPEPPPSGSAAAPRVRLRAPEETPPGAQRIVSPYDPEARWSQKRQTTWTGYKVHLTETCEPALPELLTQVETTAASTPDGEALVPIQHGLATKKLLPGEQVVDAGYVDATALVASQATHGITLLGPAARDTTWQGRAGQGFALADFGVDWAQQTVTCPQGRTSVGWSPSHDSYGNAVIHVRFAPTDCQGCPARTQCTRGATRPRALKLRPQAEHEALAAARQRQVTPAFRQDYAIRAGMEGTLSQGVRAFGLRRSRYLGLAKTHLQHLAITAAINLARLDAWWQGIARAPTRHAAFAALMS